MKKRKSISRILSLVLTVAMLCTDVSGSVLVTSAQENTITELPVQETGVEETKVLEDSSVAKEVNESEIAVETQTIQESIVAEKTQPTEESTTTEEAQPTEGNTAAEETQPTEESTETEKTQPTEESTETEKTQPIEESTAVEEVQTQVTTEEVDVNMAETGTVITGTLSLPEGAFIRGGNLEGYIYLYSDNTYSYEYFILEENSASIQYTVNFNSEITSITKAYVYLYENSNVETNLVQGYLYYTGEGWSLSDSNASEVELPAEGTGLDFELPKTLLYGNVSLPEDAVFTNGQYSVYVYAKTGTSTYSQYHYLESGSDGFFYSFDNIPLETETISQLYVYAYNNTYATSNLITGYSEYYDGTKLVTNADAAIEIDVSTASAEQDLVLRTTPIRGTIYLPEDAVHTGGNVRGCVYAKVGNNTYNSNYFTIAEGETSTDYYINCIQADVTEISQLYVKIDNINGNSSIVSNLITNRNEYYIDAESDITTQIPESTQVIEVSSTEQKFNFTLRTTNLHMKLKLNENVLLSGGDLTGYFYVKCKDDTTIYSKYITIPEESRAIEFYLNDFPSDVAELSQMYIQWNSNNNLNVNFMTGVKLYYTGTGWTNTETDIKYLLPVDNVASELAFDCAGNILNVKVMLPEGAIVNGKKLTGTMYAYTSNNTYYSKQFSVGPNEEYKNVAIALPDGVETVTYLKIKLNSDENVATNLKWNTDYYYKSTGLTTVSNDKESITLSEISEYLPVTLVKTKSISGKLILPDGAYVLGADLTGYVRVKAGNIYYRNYFTIAKESQETVYCIQIPENTESISLAEVYLNNANGLISNLRTRVSFYYTENGLTTMSGDASAITISQDSTTLDMTLEKTMSLNGVLEIPEGAFLEGGNITATVRAVVNNNTYSTNVTISEEQLDSTEYHVILPYDAAEITQLSVYLSKDNYDAKTNLTTGIYLYVDAEGNLVTDSELIGAITLTEKETQKNLGLLKLPTISGKIKLPEDGYFTGGSLSGTIWFCGDYGYEQSMEFVLEEGQTETEYSFMLPQQTTAIKYYKVRLTQMNDSDEETVIETNLDLDKYMYGDLSGRWSGNTSDIETVELVQNDTVYDIIIPRIKTISGTISIPEEAYFRDGDYSGNIFFTVNDSDYYYEFTIPEGETSTSYSVELPAAANTIAYISTASLYTAGETNLVQDYIYCGNDGKWSTRYDSLEAIGIDSPDLQKDVVLECIHTLTGKIIVPEDMVIENGRLNGIINAKINGTIYEYSFTLPNQDEITYSINLPVGTEKIDSISVTLSGYDDINTNLLLGSSYYSAETNSWGGTYLDATEVSVPLVKNVLDVELKKAVILSGSISLDADSYYTGVPLTGYFRVYVDEVAYSTYYRLEEQQRTFKYKMQLPIDSQQITKIQIKNYKNSQLDTDIITDVDLYWGADEWTSNEENAQSIDITQEEMILDFVLPKANIIKGKISLPSGLSGKYEGEVVVICNNEQYTQDFVIEEGTTNYKIELPQEKNQEYKLYYKLNLDNSEVLALGNIYVNSESNYDIAEELVSVKPVKNGANIHNIILAKWDNFNTNSIVESLHPYEGSKNYTLSYEYPGSADALILNFSRYTYVENNFDNILIYDTNDQLIGDYTGTQLANQQVRIADKGFKIVISADQNKSLYGFAIDTITVENGVPENEVAFSLVYENDEVTKMILHNTQENERGFYVSAADYDVYNKMINLSTRKIVMSNGMAGIDTEIADNPKANTSKLMLYDDKFVPICTEQYKSHPKFSVTYNYNDELNSSRIVYVRMNEMVSAPTINPSRPGYEFAGWYTDKSCTTPYEFGHVLSDSITVYAGWTENYGVLTQIEGQGQLVSEQIDGLYIPSGREIKILAQPETGWKFDSWQLTDLGESATQTGNNLVFTMPKNNVVIKAVFKREMEVEWKSTGVYIEETEIGFNDQTLLIPSGYSTVTLEGSIPNTPSPITGIAYTYSHYDVNEEGVEVYLTDTVENVSLDANGMFKLEALKVGVGTNTLTFNVTMQEGTATLVYYMIGNDSEVKLQDEVTKMDPENIDDMLKIEDLSTGIVAYWNYDNETPDDVLDDKQVLIVKKECEIGQRLMLPKTDANAIGIGSVWIIPACEQFVSGYSFKIMDFGDADLAPEPSEGDTYYGQEFDAETYLYMLVEDPDFVDVFEDSFSIQTQGVDGIAFSMIPENTVMECSLVEEDGNEVVATVGDMMSTASIDRPGFQYQNLLSNIIPKAEVKSNKIEVEFNFGDTVLYDKDGSENTTWDQVAIGGSIGVKDLSVTSAFEYHPYVNLNPFSDDFGVNLLPQQAGLLLDYTETREFKLSLGGEIGGNPDAEDGKSGQWSLKDVVKSFKETFGTGENSKKNVKLLGMNFDVEGNDMDGTIVLAAVGFNLATMSPVASASYDQIATTSTFLGFSPIMVFMVCMDIDGSVSAKIAYTYSQSTYNAKGFNIEQEGFEGTNGKIASLNPTQEFNKAGYDIEVFNISQASRTDTSKPSGKHTITATGEAKINTSLTAGAALLMCGLNIAQIKGGLYADANATLVGSAVFEKGKEPQLDLDGNLNISIGLLAGFYSRLYADTPIGDFGYDAEWSKKWELLSWGIASMSCSGIITEPSQTVGGEDSPLSQVKVTLKKKDAPLEEVKTTYSDVNGKYSFKNLSNGTYILTFEKDNYATRNEEIDISNLSVKHDVSLALAKYMEVTGLVKDSTTGDNLAGVSVTLVKASDSSVIKYAVTDENGAYKLGEKDNQEKGLTPGVYKLTARKTGYREASQDVMVVVNETGTIQANTIDMIQGSYGNSTISGYIYDIATGNSTGVGLELTVQKGIYNSTGEVVDKMTLGRDGKYSFKVNPGYYTITVKDKRTGIDDSLRYNDLVFTVSATGGQDTYYDAYVSCAANDDQIRIVLTWGDTPSDLDSHLLGPTADGRERFHTFFSNSSYSYDGMRYADLDLDDVTSYGPETTTIYYKNGSGIYSYYVHDYTNRDLTNNIYLGDSQAVVKVYKGLELISTHTVPQGVGTVWHVFDYDAATGEIMPVNTLSNMSSPDDVGTMSLDNNSAQEEEDLAIIFDEIKEKSK